jgi:hypothetical protein
MPQFALAEEPADSDDVRRCFEHHFAEKGLGSGADR